MSKIRFTPSATPNHPQAILEFRLEDFQVAALADQAWRTGRIDRHGRLDIGDSIRSIVSMHLYRTAGPAYRAGAATRVQQRNERQQEAERRLRRMRAKRAKKEKLSSAG